MEQIGAIGVTVWVFILLFALLLAVLWIALPFAVFGVKDLLGKLLAEQRRTNELLEQQLAASGIPVRDPQMVQADRESARRGGYIPGPGDIAAAQRQLKNPLPPK